MNFGGICKNYLRKPANNALICKMNFWGNLRKLAQEARKQCFDMQDLSDKLKEKYTVLRKK